MNVKHATFFSLAKNPFTTHNIYQYINKKQTNKKKRCNENKKNILSTKWNNVKQEIFFLKVKNKK
jgi:hypothetical protein